ncbi:MAG TPA: diguanylate cyclase [Candidatus Binatia bacterium]|jgi:diguanylate cyclase (GGDEF)-like protein|nr:diguanylate cyclase [Candidatus Binatia bacterium]
MITILAVDDSPPARLVTQSALQRVGYRCLVARDSDDAWRQLTPEVALVLLDVMLPGESGPDILRRMQSDPTLAKIPVIFVSGRTDAATRIQCLAMGARAFIAKPFRATVLVDAVRSVLAGGDDDLFDNDPLASVLGDEPLDDPALPTGDLVRSLLAERQRMRRQVASHTRLLSALARLHQSVHSGSAVVAQTIVQLAATVLGAERATVWTAAGRTLIPLATGAPSPPAPVRRDGNDGPARAWRGRHVVEIDDERHVPLTVAAKPVGILTVTGPPDGGPSASLAGFFCAEAALALDAAERLAAAASAAITDSLTGLANRRHLDRRLGQELRRAAVLGHPVAVLFVDIDHFKQINDAHGHERGDAALRAVAAALREAVRAVDVVARFGGEEFVLVLPETDAEGARLVGERIRTIVGTRTAGCVPGGAPLTVTIGFATAPEDGTEAAYLLTCADAAMLRGKRAGRDRVERYGVGVDVPVDPAASRTTPAVVRALLHALHIKDAGSARHSAVVGGLAARLARFMGVEVAGVRLTGQAGVLHDIGKLHVPDEVLLKPGPLDDDERVIMERHVPLGTRLVRALSETRHLAHVVHAAQEHYDGSGYPEGLAREQIPLPARIIAVVDAWHAMTSNRPYRRALPRHVAAIELRRCAGTQFDPEVVGALLLMLGVVVRGTAAHARDADGASI